MLKYVMIGCAVLNMFFAAFNASNGRIEEACFNGLIAAICHLGYLQQRERN